MNKCPICGFALVQISEKEQCLYCGYSDAQTELQKVFALSANPIILAKNKEIESQAHTALLTNTDGSLDYCRMRDISDETIKTWNLGYVSSDSKSMPLMWQKRLLFPIRSNDGTATVAFGGRTIIKGDNRPKYLNSSNGACYNKSESLFGYSNIPERAETIYLCEGYMDALTMDACGFRAVASLGTALTKQQAALLAAKSESVCIAYDADEAGEMATLKAVDILWKAGFRTEDITVLKPEHAKDVDEALKSGDSLNELRLSQYLVKNKEYKKLIDAAMHRRSML